VAALYVCLGKLRIAGTPVYLTEADAVRGINTVRINRNINAALQFIGNKYTVPN
jgi:hypothetical protein